MSSSSISLERKLERDGYLSLNQFVKYLKLYAPAASMSYPTARRLIQDGKLRAIKQGQQYRVRIDEAKRWIAEGNFDRQAPSAYSPNTHNAFPEFED